MLWDLRDADGEICVPNVEASREEIIVAIQASNTKQPDTAPHHAISHEGERIESDQCLDEDMVDRVLEGASP